MAAQSITRKRNKQTTSTTRKPTEKQVKILDTSTEHPDLTTRQVAAICDTSHSHVIQTLQRYGIDANEVKDYTSNRDKVFSGLQHRLLQSVTDADIKEASLLQRVTAAGILYDKERLETGKSTANLGVLIAQIESLQDEIRHEDT